VSRPASFSSSSVGTIVVVLTGLCFSPLSCSRGLYSLIGHPKEVPGKNHEERVPLSSSQRDSPVFIPNHPGSSSFARPRAAFPPVTPSFPFSSAFASGRVCHDEGRAKTNEKQNEENYPTPSSPPFPPRGFEKPINRAKAGNTASLQGSINQGSYPHRPKTKLC